MDNINIVKIKNIWYAIHWGKKIFWSRDKAKLIKRVEKEMILQEKQRGIEDIIDMDYFV